MKIIVRYYVVVEDYTCAYFGTFINREEAEQLAENIGGSVEEGYFEIEI